MNTRIFNSGHIARLAAVALIGVLASTGVQARSNPVDPVSNPHKLDYSDVNMRMPKYDEPFQRDGIVSNPGIFQQFTAGMPASDVENKIGKPLNQTSGSRGTEWNYNFKFLMPESENYLVCQYKVVFDDAEQVLETVWRRHQCLDIVTAAAAG